LHTILACSTFALAVTLSVTRPRVGVQFHIGPAMATTAGAVLLLLLETVSPGDIASVAVMLWRPLLTILAIMITTAAAGRVGAIDRLAHLAFSRSSSSSGRLFAGVFLLSFVTAALLNNDAAILLLTPLVLTFVAARYPGQPRLVLAFAFAVFMSAGVAPFVVSNPMNVIVASYAGLDFNRYALTMLPISLVGSTMTLALLRFLFRSDLAAAIPAHITPQPPTATTAQRRMLGLLLIVLGSYPVAAVMSGSSTWLVSCCGATAALWVARRDGTSPAQVLRRGVAWEVAIFLPAMLVLATGLRNVGLVDYLAAWYQDAGVGLLGVTAALGSAVLNNHPMALMNSLALELRPEAGPREFLAVLVGGDLGPRLLPIGSLAGLLWLDACRRLGVVVALRQFVGVGLVATIPTLIASLLLLAIWR
jgi:arsenical pump membrane protein